LFQANSQLEKHISDNIEDYNIAVQDLNDDPPLLFFEFSDGTTLDRKEITVLI
jgi:hypothetical protein